MTACTHQAVLKGILESLGIQLTPNEHQFALALLVRKPLAVRGALKNGVHSLCVCVCVCVCVIFVLERLPACVWAGLERFLDDWQVS